jgi:FixJ family two-component response regulator
VNAIAQGESTNSAAQPPCVLVVDDNKFMTRGLTLLFEEAGFGATAFNRGLEAIDYVISGVGARPSAAIIDIHLPDISGLVLSQRLREALGPTCPIIVLSGDGSMEVLNSLSHVGATYFFQKPVNSAALLERVRELVA